MIDENKDYSNIQNNENEDDDENRSEPAARQTMSDFSRTRKEEDQIKAREAELLFKAK